MDTTTTYRQQYDRADAVLRAAGRQLQTGAWFPDPEESRIAGDLALAVGPAESAPPYPDAPLWWRLGRISAHAAALRLAAQAGGWTLSGSRDDSEVTDLGGLLAGLIGVAEYIERYRHRHTALSTVLRDGDTDLLAEAPGLLEKLADTEELLDGIGLSSTLAAIATGDTAA